MPGPRFAAKVSELGTLASMLAGLGTPAGALVLMEAGMATDIIVSSAGLVEPGMKGNSGVPTRCRSTWRVSFAVRKSEFGLRPIHHHKEVRSDAHPFITVLADQCLQFLRVTLKAAGIPDSGAMLRHILCVCRRVTATFDQRDGCSLHLYKAAVAEPDLLTIYRALAISTAPGGTRKLIG